MQGRAEEESQQLSVKYHGIHLLAYFMKKVS